jgi:hypothetical protein
MKRRPAFWIWTGITGAAAWLVPPFLVWAIARGQEGVGPLHLFEFGFDQRGILTAFWWSSLAGLFASALHLVRRGRGSIEEFIRGFFGGFFLLPFAVLYEFARPSHLSGQLVWSAAALPIWFLGSLFLLWMADRRPLLKIHLGFMCLIRSGAWKTWIAVDLASGLILIALAATGVGYIFALPLRILALCVMFERFSASGEFLEADPERQ